MWVNVFAQPLDKGHGGLLERFLLFFGHVVSPWLVSRRMTANNSMQPNLLRKSADFRRWAAKVPRATFCAAVMGHGAFVACARPACQMLGTLGI